MTALQIELTEEQIAELEALLAADPEVLRRRAKALAKAKVKAKAIANDANLLSSHTH